MKNKKQLYTVAGHSYIPINERDDRFDKYLCAIIFIPALIGLSTIHLLMNINDLRIKIINAIKR